MSPELELVKHDRAKTAVDFLGSVKICAERPDMGVDNAFYLNENALQVGSLVLVRNAP